MAAGLDGRIHLTNGFPAVGLAGQGGRNRPLKVMANTFKADIHLMARLALPRLAGGDGASSLRGRWRLVDLGVMNESTPGSTPASWGNRLFCSPTPRLSGRELKRIHQWY